MRFFKAGLFLTVSLFTFTIFSQEIAAQGRIFELDASGRNGVDGEDGRSASPRPSVLPGRSGDRGGSATRPTIGQNGGDIRLLLEQSARDATEGLITISGEYTDPSTGRTSPIHRQKVPVGSEGMIYLSSRGGNGGDGGDAGRGQPGSNGKPGSKAIVLNWNPLKPGINFQVKAPTPGQHGGHGGAAGEASDGADAGDGGRIQVQVKEGSEHLLELLGLEPAQVAGGVGGDRGLVVTERNAAAGGRGGEGGTGITELKVQYEYKLEIPQNRRQSKDIPLRSRAYQANVQWTVFDYRTDADGLPVKDANGNRILDRKVVTETYPMPPLVADAANGQDGRRGADSRHQNTRAGRDGRSGKIEYVVVDSSGNPVATYLSPFQLTIADFRLQQETPDGRLEPNERGIALVTFQNTGGMPSPAGKIQFSTSGNGIELTNSGTVDLPALEPGETTSKPIEVAFQVSPTGFPDVSNESPMPSTDASLVARLSIPSISRNLSSRVNRLQISSAVTVRQMNGLSRLQTGEAARVQFEVANISSMTVDLDRAVRGILENVGQGLDNPISGSELVVVDEENRLIDFSKPYELDIGSLAPGESRVVELKIGIPSERTPGQSFRLVAATTINTNGESSRVNHEGFVVEIGQSFELTPDAKFLVVGEGGSPEVEHLQREIAALGFEADMFDLGLEGVLHILESAESNATLLQLLRGRSIVIASKGDASFNFVNFAALRSQLDALNIRVLLISSEDNMRSELMAVNSRETSSTRTSQPAENLEDLQSRLRNSPLSATSGGEVFEPHRSYTFGGPSEEDFREELRNANRAAVGVGSQAVAIGSYRPERSGGWFGRRQYRLGTAPIMGVLAPNSSQVLGITTRDALESLSAEGLLSSLAFEDILRVMERSLAGGPLSPDQLATFERILKTELALDMRVLAQGELKPSELGSQSVLEILANFRFSSEAELGRIEVREVFAKAWAVAIATADQTNSELKRELDSLLRQFANENFREGAGSFARDVEHFAKDLWKDAKRFDAPKAERVPLFILSRVPRTSIASQSLPGDARIWTTADLGQARERLEKREAGYTSREAKHSEDRARFLLPGGRGGCKNLFENAHKASGS